MDQKREPTIKFQEDLAQLTQFNPEIVTSLEPEMSAAMTLDMEKWEDTLFHLTGQIEDMLKGYLFAQNEFLPLLSSGTLDKESFLILIKKLHAFLGKTLLEKDEIKAGEFCDMQVMRWNPTTQTDILTQFIMLGKNNLREELTTLLMEEVGLSRAEVKQYLDLIKRLNTDNRIKPRESQLKFLTKENQWKEKLAVAYLTNLLTEREKKLVNKIVIICRDPAEMPAAMEVYAETTLAEWKMLDKQDRKAVSAFLANMFYQLTHIHPFPNANGRTATCLVNIFLRSINLPSILMRHVGDKTEESSSYSQVMKVIEETREPFTKHIEQRISEAEAQPFTNEQRAKGVALRCSSVRQLKVLKSIDQRIDLGRYEPVMLRYLNEAQMVFDDTVDITVRTFTQFLTFLNEEGLRLNKIQIKQAFFILTQKEDWNVPPSLAAWRGFPNNMAEAQKIGKILENRGIGDVSVALRDIKGITTPVVACSNIKLDLARSITNTCDETTASCGPRMGR